MARTLFPFLPDPSAASSTADALSLATEMAWDFDADRPVLRGGEPVVVTGAEAVKVWAWNALQTQRYRWELFSPQYGNELTRLVGQSFAAETKRAEAARYIQECLLVSPYITRVEVSGLALRGSWLEAQISISTIYGEVTLDV